MPPARGAPRSAEGAARPALDCPAPPAVPRIVLSGEVWRQSVYRKRITRADPQARAGDWVQTVDPDGRPIGFGLYNPRSEIAVRQVRLGDQPPDRAYWEGLCRRAIALRRDLLQLDQVTNAYRVIHAESDGFPGFVVDRFGDVLSGEAFSWGMFLRGPALLELLGEVLGTRHWILQTGPACLSQEGYDSPPQSSPAVPQEVLIQEFDTRFRVRFAGGHKTGFFCDQRENRQRLAAFCRDKSVLDLCCYSGGFAVQAKRLGGAAEVTAVDLDAEPLALAKANADLNQVRIRCVQSDAFAFMRDMLRIGRQFDVVVLDPPKLIRSRAEIDDGTRKHFDLNRLAMQLVAPGGLLLSCTCAGLLTHEAFRRLLYAAARQAGDAIEDLPAQELPRRGPRTMQILAQTGAAPDHPIGSHCPESEYLQAVWMRLA
jgi:23S rRNA (cytosine1962-C5)-methyltransferase